MRKKNSATQASLPLFERYLNRIWKKTALIATLLTAVATCIIIFTPLFHFIEQNITLPTNFSLRQKLGKSPSLDPRLKILLYDDATFAEYQSADISDTDWAELLRYIRRLSPAHIYVDKLFGIPIKNENDYEYFKYLLLENNHIPITVGSFISNHPIPGRVEINLENSNIYSSSNFNITSQTSLKFWEQKNIHIYGPSQTHQHFFSIGNILYFGDTHFIPFIKINNNQIIPHLALAHQEFWDIKNNTFYINKQKLPLNTKGTAFINLIAPETFYQRAQPFYRIHNARHNPFTLYECFAELIEDDTAYAQSLNKLASLSALQCSLHLNYIQPNDHVLIIPAGFTGGTDFKLTPIGSVPGGLLIASILNSALTGQWIYESALSINILGIIFLSAFIYFFTTYIKKYIGFITFFIPLTISFTGIMSFSYFNIHTPWFLWAAQSFINTAAILVQHIRLNHMRTRFTTRLTFSLQQTQQHAQKLAHDLQEAAHMAQAFLPDPLPNWQPYYHIRSFHRTLEHASGDWYCFRHAPNSDYYHVILCDITGHGVQAALVVSSCKTALNIIEAQNPEILNDKYFCDTYFKLLNQTLFRQGKGKHMLTATGVTFSPQGNLLRVIQCGHPLPLLYTLKNGKISSKPKALGQSADPIGISEDAFVLRPTEYTLEPQSSLVLYSDGIPVNKHFRIVPAYLENTSPDAPQELCMKILEEENTSFTDDVSLIFIQRIT